MLTPLAVQGEGGSQAKIITIPRSREVGQSYLTSIWTTLIAAWAALVIIYSEAPELVWLDPRASNDIREICWKQREKHA